MAHCTRHPFDLATNTCRRCGDDFCDRDLVYAYGAKQAPFCTLCARRDATRKRIARCFRAVSDVLTATVPRRSSGEPRVIAPSHVRVISSR
jgi:hypothetical protein